MSYYVIEAQNAGNFIYELITCEHCKYFIKADMHEQRYKDICSHPGAMVRPQPDGFCYYAAEKPIYEREEEHDQKKH